MGTVRFGKPGEALLIARYDGTMVGIGGVTIDPLDKTALRMRRFYVRPDFRRHGIAKELAVALMEGALKTGLTLNVNAGTEVAPSFWESLGFKPAESQHNTHVWPTTEQMASDGGTPVTVLVRKMEQTDSVTWAEMRRRMWDSLSFDEHLGDIKNMLTDDTKRTGYIALLDGSLIAGFAEVCIRGYANGCTAQPVPFLEGIWVEPEYQQRNIGQELISAIERDLTNRGFHELCSDAGIENTISHHAHVRWGFDETDRVVYFRKSLS